MSLSKRRNPLQKPKLRQRKHRCLLKLRLKPLKLRRNSFSFFLSFFLLLNISAASAADSVSSPASPGETYVTASIAEPNNLIPIFASDASSQEIVQKVYNGLLKYNPRLELEGDLAEWWATLDEGKTIVFHLREGVKWHDGQPFTANDVRFTYEKLTDPKLPTPFRGDFEKVESVDVLDPVTVRVRYKEAFSPALSSWTFPVMPEHVLKNEDLTRTEFSRKPVGTGPFKFHRWRSGESVELRVFEQYFRGRAKLDRLIFRVIPDQTTMFLELNQESIDAMSLTPLQYRKQTDDAFFKENYDKYSYPSFGYTWMGLNLRQERFQDLRVRRAINMAIDKQELIDAVLLGLGRVSTGPFTPDSWAHNPQVQAAAFDPAEAKRLLAEAGWVDANKDGVLEKDGKPFEFTLATNQGNFQRQMTAEIMQRRLADIGIKMQIRVAEWSAFLNEIVDKRKFDAVLLSWNLGLDPDPFDIWHSSKIDNGGFNIVGYNNPTTDELIEKGRKYFDLSNRQKVYYEFHRIMYEEQPYVFLYVTDVLPIIHRRFRNVELTALGLGYNFNEWNVPYEERLYKRFRMD